MDECFSSYKSSKTNTDMPPPKAHLVAELAGKLSSDRAHATDLGESPEQQGHLGLVDPLDVRGGKVGVDVAGEVN